MKQKIILFLGCMLVALGLQAEEVTKTVDFSTYTAGTQYAKNEKHDLGDGLVIYTTECHFTTQLRIYASSTHDGFVVSDPLPGRITKMTFNAGYKKDVLNVFGSADGQDWILVGGVTTTATTYKDYTLDFPQGTNYKCFKLDVAGADQIRIAKMSVTYKKEASGDEPSKPTVLIDPELTASCKFLEEQEVIISCVIEGAKIYYTTDGTNPTAESTEYSEPFTVTETTTVKAIAVKDGASSGVVTATYTNVEAEVSPVGGDSSDDALTIEQGTEITITPIENNTATYRINDAEAITITEATIFNANEVGAMKLAVTSTLGSDSKTATYYYDVVAETPKVTALLTTDEYENQTTPGTYTNTSVKSKTGVWNGNMIVNSTDLQLRAKDGAHIQSPVFPGKVVSVSVVFSNNTTTNTARGFVVMPSTFTGTSATKDTKDCLGSASYKGKDDPTSTVELSKEIYSFKIYATGGAIYMKSIKVVYEKPDDHVLKVGSTGWATLSLGLDTKIPSGLNCYAISSVANETATLTAISEVLPAHTSVIVRGEPNTDYTFEYLDEYMGAYGECNMLEGSIANTYIAGDAYVLANGNNGVGLYKATLNKDAEGKTGTTHFLNNANKAYLPVSALTAEQRSNGFRLHIGGTTSIQNSEFNIQDSAIIYDLQGRRVEKMEKGIYIVNGKKVIVK